MGECSAEAIEHNIDFNYFTIYNLFQEENIV